MNDAEAPGPALAATPAGAAGCLARCHDAAGAAGVRPVNAWLSLLLFGKGRPPSLRGNILSLSPPPVCFC